LKILIVDDDTGRRTKLVEHINGKNIADIDQLSTAGSVDEAKVFLKQCYYDILVLDVVLPKRAESSPSAANSLALLGQISREGLLKKPGKIIGVTAYSDDIEKYRDQFEQYCAVVIEAQNSKKEWKEKITESVQYSLASRISRTVKENGVEVLTVHGIRTFGEWQNRLKSLVRKSSDEVTFGSYEYGYFSSIALLFPYARDKAVKSLAAKMKTQLEYSKAKHLIVFSHSFGTYLTANAIHQLSDTLPRFEKVTLVLCGSVLKSTHDWSEILKFENCRIINECGDNDVALWFSNAAVLGCGMAGRVGFFGFNNSRFVNRFYIGGHSLYFEGDTFFNREWLPLILNEDYEISPHDERVPQVIKHGISDKIASMLGSIKPFVYLSIPVAACGLLLAHLIT